MKPQDPQKNLNKLFNNWVKCYEKNDKMAIQFIGTMLADEIRSTMRFPAWTPTEREAYLQWHKDFYHQLDPTVN